MRIACWMPKVANAHSEYVILIAFQLQHWLQECVSCLVVTETGCLLSGTNWIFIIYFSLFAVFERTACSGVCVCVCVGGGGICVKLLSVLHSSEQLVFKTIVSPVNIYPVTLEMFALAREMCVFAYSACHCCPISNKAKYVHKVYGNFQI